MPEGVATPSDRPDFSSMADDYARHALSQRAAFEATHPAVLAAARQFSEEPVLRVADLGAADGVNSHGLIRSLAEKRAGRPLIYALVDLPTNAWGVATDHLRYAFGDRADGPEVLVIPAPGEAGRGISDVGTGAHYASPEAHGEACRRVVERGPPPATVISMAGIPLHQAPCLPSGSVHVGVTGTAMHWIADAGGLASTGSVFPGYPDHADEGERRGWRVAAARQWERLLEMRAIELAPGAGLSPRSRPPRPGPGKDGALRGDHRRHEPVARRLVPRGAHRRRNRLRGRRSGVDADTRRDPTLLRARRARPARERRTLPSRQSLLARRSRAVRAGLCSELDRVGHAALPPRLARQGEDRARGLLADFLRELEERVADAPGRYRWDYIEALVICRKADSTERDRTRL